MDSKFALIEKESKPLPPYKLHKLLGFLIQDKIFVEELGWVDLIKELKKRKIYLEESNKFEATYGSSGDIYLSVPKEENTDYPKILKLILGAILTHLFHFYTRKEEKEIKEKVKNILKTPLLIREKNKPEISYIVGGGGGRTQISTIKSIKELVSSKGELPLTLIISPFDDGGSSRKLQEQLREYYGYIPPPGDQNNIIAGFVKEFYSFIIRYRIKGNEKITLKQAIQKSIEEAKVNLEKEEIPNDEEIKQFWKKIEEYVDFFDENFVKKGIIDTAKQSIGNLLHTAIMLKINAFTKQGVIPEKYYEGLDILFWIFDIRNINILLCSWDEATQYAILRDFEIKDEKDPIGIPLTLEEGVCKAKLGDKEIILERQGENKYILKVNNETFYIEEEFGPFISKKSRTIVKTEDGKKIELDKFGRGTEIKGKTTSFILKGRLVIEQTRITDNLHLSPIEQHGFLEGIVPSPSKEVIEHLKNTQGGIFVGPGGLYTSLLVILEIPEIIEILSKRRWEIPVVWIQNPTKDNENLHDYYALLETLEKHMKKPINEIFSHYVINDLEESVKRMKETFGIKKKDLFSLLNEFDKIDTSLLNRDAKGYSVLAKFRRGAFMEEEEIRINAIFEGIPLNTPSPSQLFANYLKETYPELEVLHIPLLGLTYKEIRKEGKAEKEVSLGYPTHFLAEFLESLIIEHVRKKNPYYTYLLDKRYESKFMLEYQVRSLKDMFNLSFLEALRYLYYLNFYNSIFPLPWLDLSKISKVDGIIVNFATALSYLDSPSNSKGKEFNIFVKNYVVKAIDSFLLSGKKLIILTGLGFEGVYENFISQLSPLSRKNLILFSNSGALMHTFDEFGEECVYDLGKVFEGKEKAKEIVEEVIKKFNLNKPLIGISGQILANPVRVVEREAQITIEMHEWVNLYPHILKRILGFSNGGDLRGIICDFLNKRFEEERIPFCAHIQGPSAINIIVDLPYHDFRNLNPDEKLRELASKHILKYAKEHNLKNLLVVGEGNRIIYNKLKRENFNAIFVTFFLSKHIFNEKDLKLYFSPSGDEFFNLLQIIYS